MCVQGDYQEPSDWKVFERKENKAQMQTQLSFQIYSLPGVNDAAEMVANPKRTLKHRTQNLSILTFCILQCHSTD